MPKHPTTWFRLNLGDASLAGDAVERLQQAFEHAFEAAGRPVDMAAFTRHESDGRLHCEVMVYLSPAAATLAKQYDAVACRRPEAGDLSLLAGAEGAHRRLFGND